MNRLVHVPSPSPPVNQRKTVQNSLNRRADVSRILHSSGYAGKSLPLSLSKPKLLARVGNLKRG